MNVIHFAEQGTVFTRRNFSFSSFTVLSQPETRYSPVSVSPLCSISFTQWTMMEGIIGEVWDTKSASIPSPILTGVPIRVGMQGRGQRSRHSGCETTRQSRHFRESLPNLIRFPHGTQDSGLITVLETKSCRRIPPLFWGVPELSVSVLAPVACCSGRIAVPWL